MTHSEDFEGEVIEDVEPYEGSPIYLSPVDVHGAQDDEGAREEPEDSAFMPREIAGLLSKISTAPNTWRETLDWFKSHRTKELIGFDPDGMCLKIQRTARGIPPRYLTARDSMLATPKEHRIHEVRNLRRGMVTYFADPNDSNPFDHIAGMIGRVKGFNPDSLHDTLHITNSVVADELVVVRGSYFEEHWGDDFKFAATWLNGYELDVPLPKDRETKVEKFHDTAPEYNLELLAKSDRAAAKRALDQIITQVRRLPDSPKLVRVQEFKLQVKDDKILDLRILDQAVNAGRIGLVKDVRDEIRRLIRALPDQ